MEASRSACVPEFPISDKVIFGKHHVLPDGETWTGLSRRQLKFREVKKATLTDPNARSGDDTDST